MPAEKPTVLVTGISGNLGLRLLRQLGDFRVVGVDMAPPAEESALAAFERIDLGQERSCQQSIELLKSSGATAVVHLAFVIDPIRTGVLDVPRMWQINVAGTARVMEAIAVVNRLGGAVRKFIFPSSVSAYGPELPYPVREDYPLGAHTLPYAIHKQESDEVVRGRAESLGECSTFVLRPNIFTGASMQNYLVGALRGTPTGRGRLGKRMRDKGTRLPMLLPFGAKYLEKRFQFVHVDDMARLIVWILRRPETAAELIVLNVAGRGEPLTLADCARIADSKIKRLPGRGLCRMVLQLMWDLGISGIPPEALPYMIGSYTMNTRKLQEFLGPDYDRVIQHTVESALRDSFRREPAPRASAVTVPIR